MLIQQNQRKLLKIEIPHRVENELQFMTKIPKTPQQRKKERKIFSPLLLLLLALGCL